MSVFLTPIDLSNLELKNALAQLLGSDPTGIEGKFFYHSGDKTIHFYNGTAWIILGRLDQITAPTADLSLNSHKITNLLDPTSAQDAATKTYVDNLVAGIKWKASVRAATTANGTLATAFENGDVIDGVTLATGDRILLKNQTAGAENGIYCLDDQTEILSRHGWKRHPDLVEGEDVLTLNIETGLTEWQPALGVHAFAVDDIEVLELNAPGHSSISTLNHRWPVRRRRWDAARNAPGEPYLAIRESGQLTGGDSLIVAARSSGLPSSQTYSNAFVELVGWFVTEGHIRRNNSGTLSTVVRIVQSAVVNQPYVDRIRGTLTAVAGPSTAVMKRPRGGEWKPEWRERPDSNGHGLTTFELNSVMGSMLCRIAPDRVASPEFIAALTEDQLRLFVDTVVAADGHTRVTGQRTVGQKSLARLAPIQMACTLLGISTSIDAQHSDGTYTLELRRAVYSQPHLGPRARRVRYSGTVWCPRTENTTWVARRNGTVYMTGNTVAASGAPTRATDADTAAEILQAAVFVSEGTVNADSGWVLSTNAPITLNTTALVFAQFTGGSMTAGAGLTLTGSTIDVVAASGSGIVVNADNIDIDPVSGLPVNRGGTGAITAAGAAAALGFMRRFSASVGDTSATSFNIDHNFGSLDVVVQIYRNSDGVGVEANVTRSTTNRVVVVFAVAPGTNAYRVVVLG